MDVNQVANCVWGGISTIAHMAIHTMEWGDWQTYLAPVIVFLTIAVFIYRWVKKSAARCCGGRCGCAVSKRKKKGKGVNAQGIKP